MPATRSEEPARIDVPGTALLAAAVVSLLVPLTEGRALGWPAWSWVLLGLFLPAVAGFVLVERRLEQAGGHPIVPPTLLQLPGMRLGLVLAVPFFGGFGAFMFVSALTLQDGVHLGPLRSGLTLVPMAVAFSARRSSPPRSRGATAGPCSARARSCRPPGSRASPPPCSSSGGT